MWYLAVLERLERRVKAVASLAPLDTSYVLSIASSLSPVVQNLYPFLPLVVGISPSVYTYLQANLS